MRIVKNLWNSLTNLSEQENTSTIIIQGNERINIGEVKHLLIFTEDQITIKSELGFIELHGNDLSILFMNLDEIVVEGTINEIKFSPV